MNTDTFTDLCDYVYITYFVDTLKRDIKDSICGDKYLLPLEMLMPSMSVIICTRTDSHNVLHVL